MHYVYSCFRKRVHAFVNGVRLVPFCRLTAGCMRFLRYSELSRVALLSCPPYTCERGTLPAKNTKIQQQIQRYNFYIIPDCDILNMPLFHAVVLTANLLYSHTQ